MRPAVHTELCGDYQAYGESDNGGEQAEPLSDAKLRSISEHKVITLANKRMNETDHSLPSGSKIINISALAIAAEERGTDATGIAYSHASHLTFYKRPWPAHLMCFWLPEDARCIMGTPV